MKKTRSILFAGCAFLLTSVLHPEPAQAAVVNAATCAQTDVQTAMASAASGDTLIIPAGTCSWTSLLPISKPLAIQGAADGGTTLQDYGFSVDGVDGWSVQHLQFQHETAPIPDSNYGVVLQIGCISAASNGWWVNDLTLTSYGNGAMTTCSDSQGVIANSLFVQGPTGYDAAIYVNGSQNRSWAVPAFFGQAGNYVFIEDVKFVCAEGSGYCGHAILSQWGGSYVARCNAVVSTDQANNFSNGYDAHGYGHGPAGNTLRGSRQIEAYGNLFVPKGYESFAVNLRGSSSLIHHNRWTPNPVGHYSFAALYLQDYRASNQGQPMQYPSDTTNCASEAGGCTVAEEATCILDHEGWRGCDQIGTGQDVPDGGRQQPMPTYLWDNQDTSGNAATVGVGGTNNPTVIQVGRDYFVDVAPTDYSPFTYPHPLRGLPSTTTCLTDNNSRAGTAITFWPDAGHPDAGSVIGDAGADGGDALADAGVDGGTSVDAGLTSRTVVGGNCGCDVTGSTTLDWMIALLGLAIFRPRSHSR